MLIVVTIVGTAAKLVCVSLFKCIPLNKNIFCIVCRENYMESIFWFLILNYRVKQAALFPVVLSTRLSALSGIKFQNHCRPNRLFSNFKTNWVTQFICSSPLYKNIVKNCRRHIRYFVHYYSFFVRNDLLSKVTVYQHWYKINWHNLSWK